MSVHAQQSNSTFICQYANIEGISPLYQEFQRPGHLPCLWYCTQNPYCEAVTHDFTLDICRFHFEADVSCLQMTSASSKSLWIISEYDHHNAHCLKAN